MTAPVRVPLDGELLAPGDVLIVTAAMHPLRVEHDQVVVPAGSSVTEIVAACEARVPGSRLASGAYVEINGLPVPERLWPHVRVKAGNHVMVKAVPRGFLVPLVATALTSAFPILGTNALLGAIVTAGLGLLAQFIMSSLFPPAQTKAEKAKTVYSIAGARNEVAKWEPMPSVLGRVRMAPKYASSPVTEFSGDDQYLRMLLAVGYGPLLIEDIKIGETPVTDYDDVEIEVRQGFAGDPAITLFTGQPVQEDLSIVTSQVNGPHTRTTAEDAVEIGVDLVAPQGIYKRNDKGSFKQYSVSLRIDYKNVGTPDSGYALFENVTITGDNADPLRRTYRKMVPTGQYVIRITRLSQDEDLEPNKGVTVHWTALRIFRAAPAIDFPKPLALIAIRIRASDQLNGTPDNINCIVSSLVEKGDGTGFYTGGTPADLFRHVLQGPANKRPVAVSQIDLVTVASWRAFCVAKGFLFNMVRDFRASVWETLRDVCAAGRAVPVFRDGKWSVAWEDTSAPIVQHFTPRNSWNFSRRQDYRTLPHALRVKFQDQNKGWIEDERLVYADGYSKANATLVEQLELPGITDRALIHKHARYRLAEGRLRPATFTLSVDAEHLVCTRGDRVYCAHDVLMNSLASGRVAGVSGQTISLDEPVVMEAGKSYAIRFRRADGTSLLRSVNLAVGEQAAIVLTGSGAVPAAGDLWSFGEAGKEAGVYRVKSIRPLDDLAAELELVDDAPGIDTADSQAIPAYDSGLVIPADLRQFPPYGLQIMETVEVRGGVPVFVTTLMFNEATGVNAGNFLAEATDSLGRVVRAEATLRYARFDNLAPGLWVFRVQSVYPDRRSVWSDPLTVSLVGQDSIPPDPLNFNINAIGPVATFTWDEPATPILQTEIRYTPATSGAQWADAVPLLTNVIGSSAQLAFQSGTFLAKHVSYGGSYSDQAVSITVSDANEAARNVVEELFELAPFDGAHNDTVDAPNGLELASLSGGAEFALFGTYQPLDVVDLGEVFTSRLTAITVAEGVNVVQNVFDYPDMFAVPDVFAVRRDQWSVDAQVSTTNDDPASGSAVWSDWTRLVVGDYTARAFRFRILLAASEFGITPRVTLFHVAIDMPDRIIAGNDVVVPPAGLYVTFDPPFREVQGMSRSDQNLQPGDTVAVSAITPEGFSIQFYNGGAGVSRTFDFLAKGYGRRAT